MGSGNYPRLITWNWPCRRQMTRPLGSADEAVRGAVARGIVVPAGRLATPRDENQMNARPSSPTLRAPSRGGRCKFEGYGSEHIPVPSADARAHAARG
jgi:hypothetical protein